MNKVNKRNLFQKNNGQTQPKPVETPPGQVPLTLENAPIFSAKFLEGIRDQLVILNKHLEKMNG